MKHLYFVVILMITASFTLHGQQVISAKAVNKAEAASLTAVLKDYRLFRLHTSEIHEYVQSKKLSGMDVRLSLEGYAELPLFLYAQDILSDNYLLTVGTEKGRERYERPVCMTYAGRVKNDNSSSVRLTITPDLFYGMITGQGKQYFIEPLRYLDKQAAADVFVVYETKDVVPYSGIGCGVEEVAHRSRTFTNDDETGNKGTGDATGTCKMIEMAIASDDSMLLRYGTVAEVQQHNIAVMNTVVGIYVDAQIGTQNLQFKIVEQYVASSTATNPLSPNYDRRSADTLLNYFGAWARITNNFTNTFDLATLWTTRDISSGGSSSVIGLAWIGGTCSNTYKYQLLEDAFGSGYFAGVLAAHETGHNLGAGHDASGEPFIMAPSVSNVNTFSSTSLTAMNAYLTTGSVGTRGDRCFALCDATAPVAAFNASTNNVCTGSSITYTDFSVGTITGRTWSFTGGNVSSSTDSVVTVTYATAGTKTVSLTVTNSAGSNNNTTSVFVGATATAPCTVSTGCSGSEVSLLGVNIAGISHSTSPVFINGSYQNYICSNNTALRAGTTYVGTMRIGFPGVAARNSTGAVYIDYNNDGDYGDANEQVHIGTTCMEGYYSFSFTTPASPPVSNTWLSLRAMARPCVNTNTSGCTSGCANVEDYGVYFAATVPLSVSLLRFEGRSRKEANELSWQTGSEADHDYFEVERSEDGVGFISVGRVMARGNAGAGSAYLFNDPLPQTNTDLYYYRLKIMGKDGGYTYSNVVTLRGGRNVSSAIVYPNPVARGAALRIKTVDPGPHTVDVFNSVGQLVYRITDATDEVLLPVPSAWAPGVYLVKVAGADGRYVHTVVVE